MANILRGNLKTPGVYEQAAEKGGHIVIEKLSVLVENAMDHLVLPETITEDLEDQEVLQEELVCLHLSTCLSCEKTEMKGEEEFLLTLLRLKKGERANHLQALVTDLLPDPFHH